MTNKEAIKVIRNNWPDSRYSMLREALQIAINAMTTNYCAFHVSQHGCCQGIKCEGESCKYFTKVDS